jgi:c-di-GMP-binding flagellar brake protein YcgR
MAWTSVTIARYVAGRIDPWNRQARRVEQEPGGAEHRKFERVDNALLVSYSIADEFAPEFTETYDVAPGGMAMITNAELHRGDPIIVQLELRGDPHPLIRIRGVVRWSRFDTMLQRYRTGVAFTDLDDATRADLARYIDTLRLLRDMGVL